MAKDRNKVRSAIISWLKMKLELEQGDMSYKGLLFKYFNMLDVDSDGMLDAVEIYEVDGKR